MKNEKNTSAEPILLGALHGAYGLKGWVRVQPFQDTEALMSSENWQHITREGKVTPIRMEQARVHGAGIVAKLAGIDTPEAAADFRGAVGLYREDFPPLEEDEYYWVDLIGSEVINKEGALIGTVKGMIDNGVHDILEVRREDGKAVLIPFIEAYLDHVDPDSHTVTVDWDPSWD